ncbi:MAG: polysaccharide deacetylase family protein [Pseudomonadota bacterium]
MKTLMIHDIRKEYFELNLAGYCLTFDDGLFSQFYYAPLLRACSPDPIYFIVSSFIRPGKARKMFDGEYIDTVKSKKYMYDAVIKGEFVHFMTLAEIQTLASQETVRIGCHSHFHEVIPARPPRKKKRPSQWKMERYPYYDEISGQNLNLRSKLAFQGYDYREGRLVRRPETAWEDFIKQDTELSLKWFESNLGFTPKMYCFPFNEHSDRLIAILKQFGFEEFYGARSGENKAIRPRIDIDKLLYVNAVSPSQ